MPTPTAESWRAQDARRRALRTRVDHRLFAGILCSIGWLVLMALAPAAAWAAGQTPAKVRGDSVAEPPQASSVEASSHKLSLEQAVTLALQQNPELAAIRRQHEIAAAGMVIARTY